MPKLFDLVIMEREFATPVWEPSDCSVIERASGEFEVVCHFSSRLVAVVDTVDDADALLMLAKLSDLKARKPEKAPQKEASLAAWFGPKIAYLEGKLRELGFDDDLTAPIAGSNERLAATPEVVLFKSWLKSADEASVPVSDGVVGREILSRIFPRSRIDSGQPCKAILPLGGDSFLAMELTRPAEFQVNIRRVANYEDAL